MIINKSPQIWRIVAYVGRPAAALLVWDLVVVYLYQFFHWQWIGSRHVPLTLYGSAVSIIIGFRNNSSYGRWWEGRRI